jgi:hypothetical protein
MPECRTGYGDMDAAKMDVTRASARLPGLDIEIVHRPAVEDDIEEISIVSATPSVEAFVRTFETAGLWTQAMHSAWQPWLAAARNFALPWALEARHRATVHPVPRRSAARRIRSARSGLARACHREHRGSCLDRD